MHFLYPICGPHILSAHNKVLWKVWWPGVKSPPCVGVELRVEGIPGGAGILQVSRPVPPHPAFRETSTLQPALCPSQDRLCYGTLACSLLSCSLYLTTQSLLSHSLWLPSLCSLLSRWWVEQLRFCCWSSWRPAPWVAGQWRRRCFAHIRRCQEGNMVLLTIVKI